MFGSKLISFSDDGNLLAICNSSGVLKLWDTSSGILEHEFHPFEYLSSSITCVQFSPKLQSKKNFKNKKKKSIESISTSSELLIALGTLEGTILLYSPGKQEVKEKFHHSSTSPVTGISWHLPHELVSVGEDKKLIVWSIKNVKLCILDIIGSKSFCALGENRFVIGNTNLQFLKYDQKTKEAVDYVIPGHKTFIMQMVPIFLNKEAHARYFLSAAENDRFVYAWSTSSELKEPIGSFMVMDIVRTICCMDMGESSVGIGVVTEKGHLHFFLHHFNGSKSLKPSRYQGTLRIKSKSKKSLFLPVISAHFLSESELLITYGTELFPYCERISVKTFDGEVCWNRNDPSVFSSSKESTLVKTVTPYVPNAAVHLMPTQMNPPEMREVSAKRKKGGEFINLPMEERLDALALTQPLLGVPDGRPLDNYVHLLVQALHSKDSVLLNSILAKVEDEEIINNTVRRLPVSHVVPFLQYLQELIVGKGLKNVACINWIKSVLYHHMSLLSTVSDKENLLQPFYAIFDARTSSLLAVAKLHARISLLLTHVKNRHENVTQNITDSHSEALLRYREDSSDEEDVRVEMEGAPSESEDIWDDWTEEDDDDEEEVGSGNLQEAGGKRGGAAKRKMVPEDDFVFLSDSDDHQDGVGDNDNDNDVQSVSESE